MKYRVNLSTLTPNVEGESVIRPAPFDCPRILQALASVYERIGRRLANGIPEKRARIWGASGGDAPKTNGP